MKGLHSLTNPCLQKGSKNNQCQGTEGSASSAASSAAAAAASWIPGHQEDTISLLMRLFFVQVNDFIE